MEKFNLTELDSKDPVKLMYEGPTMVLFFTLKELLMIKELNKDLVKSHLKAVSIYIGDEAKKVHIWRQKEPECMPSYFGGTDLKALASQGITELPWILILKNNHIILSCKFSDIERPFVKSLLRKFPEFKAQTNKTIKKIDKILTSPSLTIDEKLSLLEEISVKGNEEIQLIQKELDEKDKILRNILYKV